MRRTRAFYSVLQYVPDGSRAEAANVGVALFVPETGAVDVKPSPSLARVRQFFRPDRNDLQTIEHAVKAAALHLKAAKGEFQSEEDFARYAAAGATAVRLTAPRLVVVTDPEAELAELYAELVGDLPAARQRAARAVPLPVRLAEIFGRLEAEKKVWRPGRVAIPETRRKLTIPLAYQNGRTNLVLPQSLADAGKAEKRLPLLGFDGRLIYQHKIEGEDAKLVVVSADPGADKKTETHFADVLNEFQVQFVPYSRAEEFAAEVEKTAH
ncbi:MAG: DUF3037 domain-containing protein [Gemmataceae bacterium]